MRIHDTLHKTIQNQLNNAYIGYKLKRIIKPLKSITIATKLILYTIINACISYTQKSIINAHNRYTTKSHREWPNHAPITAITQIVS